MKCAFKDMCITFIIRTKFYKEWQNGVSLESRISGVFRGGVKMKVAQLCLTLCDPMDYTVHGILQARILEWVAFPFSRGSSQPRDQTQVSCIAGRFFTAFAGEASYECAPLKQ